MFARSSDPLVVLAALPRELAPFARDLKAARILDRDGILVQTGRSKGSDAPVLLVTAGMGAARAALAFEAALAQGPVSAILSVGLAGACDPQLNPGDCLAAGLIIDSRTGERFRTDPDLTPFTGVADAGAVLVTSPALAGPAEKLRLHHTYSAAAVDMEAATVARLARAHGLRFGALKAISDAQHFDLTHLTPFAGRRGQFRTVAFALRTALRPGQWRAAVELGRGSASALASLTAALHNLVAASSGDLAL